MSRRKTSNRRPTKTTHKCIHEGIIATLAEQSVTQTRWQKSQNGTLKSLKDDVHVLDKKVSGIQATLDERDRQEEVDMTKTRNKLEYYGIRLVIISGLMYFIANLLIPFFRYIGAEVLVL